jgi:phytoene synthase
MTDVTHAIRDAARAHAPDLYLSALLAPRPARDDLVTLAAYAGEIARVPLTVRDPMLAEIRLAWWRETIEKSEPGLRTGNPIADALLEVIERRKLVREEIMAPLLAHEHYLARGTLTAGAELDAYIDGAATASLRLAAAIIDPAGLDVALAGAAGGAWGRACLALELPHHLAHGRSLQDGVRPLTSDPTQGPEQSHEGADPMAALVGGARAQLALARPLFGAASRSIRAAVLPVALVEPYLRAVEKPGRDPARQVAEIAPVSRAWRLWLASAGGKV